MGAGAGMENRNLQKLLLFIRFFTCKVRITSHYRNQVLSITQALSNKRPCKQYIDNVIRDPQ